MLSIVALFISLLSFKQRILSRIDKKESRLIASLCRKDSSIYLYIQNTGKSPAKIINFKSNIDCDMRYVDMIPPRESYRCHLVSICNISKNEHFLLNIEYKDKYNKDHAPHILNECFDLVGIMKYTVHYNAEEEVNDIIHI